MDAPKIIGSLLFGRILAGTRSTAGIQGFALFRPFQERRHSSQKVIRSPLKSCTLSVWKIDAKSCLGGINFCIYSLMDSWQHLVANRLPFGSLFGGPWLSLAPLWLPLASIWRAFGSLSITFGSLQLTFLFFWLPFRSTFAHPTTLSIRSGVLLVHFRPSWREMAPNLEPICRPSGAERVKNINRRLVRFMGAFGNISLICLGLLIVLCWNPGIGYCFFALS